MCEAHDGTSACRAESIEGGSFHLDGKCAQLARPRDRRLGFAIGSIRRPCRAPMKRDAWQGASRLFYASEKRRIGRLGERGARQIVIACPLVAECAIDEDEVWRGPDRSNLP